jgi:hypothetical protein
MGDEDRGRKLPRRVRGATGTGPAPTSAPVLSEEVRQRMHEAVQAERALAVEPDQESTTESTMNGTAPVPADSAAAVPADSDVMTPDVDYVSLAAEPEPLTEPLPTLSASADLPSADHAAEPRPNGSAPTDHAPVTVPPAGRPKAPPEEPVRRRLFTARMVTVAVAIIVVALLEIGFALYLTKSPPAAPTATLQGQEAAAATWIAQQVSHSAVVSCDPAMCSALTAEGFPGRNLRVVGPTAPYPAPYPLTSTVVVVTPAVEGFYGSSLTSNWAPAVLATFGSRDTLITVRVIVPDGAAAYRAKLNADLTDRKAIGNSLLGVNLIALWGTARAQLVAGQVDSRLMLAIAYLAAKEPVDILEFGNIGPGGDADMPLRYADLAVSDPGAQLVGPKYVQSILTGLGTVPAAYRPARTATVVLPGGQTVLRVEFTAPSPLGILHP